MRAFAHTALPANLPVTALHLPVTTLQEIYQACRGWTIATFQHITETDFIIRLLGGSIADLGSSSDLLIEDSEEDSEDESRTSSSTTSADVSGRQRRRRTRNLNHHEDETDSRSADPPLNDRRTNGAGYSRLGSTGRRTGSIARGTDFAPLQPILGPESERISRRRRRLEEHVGYDAEANAGADVFASTVAAAAFEAALHPTVRILSEGYEPANEVRRVLLRWGRGTACDW